MDTKERNKIIKYWEQTADHDFETMKGLYRIERYPDSLFYGHIVIEKILKALVVLKINENAPRIHNLIKLSELADLSFNEDELDLLDALNNFNIRARYPDYKLSFYKNYKNKEKVDYYFKRVSKLYTKLCQMLNQKIK